jgi:nitric oxide reductase NorQ protein
VLEAHENFLLIISYNPGYQSVIKDLKHSTRQRFVAIEFDYPRRELEADIIAHETALIWIWPRTGAYRRKSPEFTRSRPGGGVSTRLLIYAGQLMIKGSAHRACQLAITKAITDDPEAQRAVDEIISTILP